MKILKLDYDLSACLEYNPQESFSESDIAKVLAVIEGENDGDNWHWVLQLNDNRLMYLTGWCDYTGWDCQSWAEAFEFGGDTNKSLRVIMQTYGYQHKYLDLYNQIKNGKTLTWREKQDKVFNNPQEITMKNPADLQAYSDDDLKKELARRKAKALGRPKALKTLHFGNVINLLEAYFDQLDKGTINESIPDDIFPEVIRAIYGTQALEWLYAMIEE